MNTCIYTTVHICIHEWMNKHMIHNLHTCVVEVGFALAPLADLKPPACLAQPHWFSACLQGAASSLIDGSAWQRKCPPTHASARSPRLWPADDAGARRCVAHSQPRVLVGAPQSGGHQGIARRSASPFRPTFLPSGMIERWHVYGCPKFAARAGRFVCVRASVCLYVRLSVCPCVSVSVCLCVSLRATLFLFFLPTPMVVTGSHFVYRQGAHVRSDALPNVGKPTRTNTLA